jgi:competence protein ComEC
MFDTVRRMKRLAPILLLAGCQPATEPPAPAPKPPTDATATTPPEPTPPAFAGPVKVTFVDVDEGDAILITAGDFDALIDTGSNSKWDGQLKDALESVTGPLEILFLTHPRADHYEQTDAVFELLEVSRVITNGEGRGPPRDKKALKFYGEYEAALKAEGVDAEPAAEDESYGLGPGVSIEVYSTGGRYNDTSDGSNINDDGLVLMLTYAGRKVLFAADIEERTGKRLVTDYCGSEGGMCSGLKADVLKVPHHGSAHFSQDFFERVAPSYAVISAGFHVEKHCLPRDESYQALSLLGPKIFSTSAEGTGNVSVTISSDGNMQWDYPDEPVFVWEGMKKRKCVGPLVYEQGTPRPFVAE